MPYLVDPAEIQSIINDHHGGKEGSRKVDKTAAAPSDTDATSCVNPAEIQDMIARHDSLVEEGRLSSDSEPYWKQATGAR